MIARLHRDCLGATAVEFALLLPVLVAVLVGTLEFGRALWVRQDLQFAVEEAARFALANDDASAAAIVSRAQSRFQAVGPVGLPVQFEVTSDAAAISVTATAQFLTLAPGILPEGAVTMTAKARLPR